MEDNGLIKYYRDRKRGKDLTSTKKHKDFRILIGKQGDVKSHQTYLQTPEGIYYTKCASKAEIDAETVLSQVFCKLGIQSAIYLPAGHKNKYVYAVSNDITNENTILAKDYYEQFWENIRKDSNYSGTTIGQHPFYLPSIKEQVEIDYNKFITPEAMRTLQIVRGLDMASYNTDRNWCNYYFQMENGVITDIILIDHAMSGANVESTLCEELVNCLYFNEFNKILGRNNYSNIISNFKNNEVVQDIITPQELAETVGSVNMMEEARDIKGTIGYKIDQGYLDVMAKSFDYTAEELLKP